MYFRNPNKAFIYPNRPFRKVQKYKIALLLHLVFTKY